MGCHQSRTLLDTSDTVFSSTTLHHSSSTGRTLEVQELLRRGADVIAWDQRGRLPIHLAALKGHCDVIALLLKHKSTLQLYITDPDGEAPLHKALKQGHVKAAELLLASGASATQCLRNGATPLHLAAERGMAEAVHLLIRHGAEVNAQRSNSQTALFEVAFSGCIDAAKALLQHGADPGLRNIYGETAASRAASQQMAKLLRRRAPRLRVVTPAAFLQSATQQRGGAVRSSAPRTSPRMQPQYLEHVMRQAREPGTSLRFEWQGIEAYRQPSAPPQPETEAHALQLSSHVHDDKCDASAPAVGIDSAPDEEPPVDLTCPITQDLFEDPVMAADGVNYSRAAIAQWLVGHDTSPASGARLESKVLYPNHEKREAVRIWRVATGHSGRYTKQH